MRRSNWITGLLLMGSAALVGGAVSYALPSLITSPSPRSSSVAFASNDLGTIRSPRAESDGGPPAPIPTDRRFAVAPVAMASTLATLLPTGTTEGLRHWSDDDNVAAVRRLPQGSLDLDEPPRESDFGFQAGRLTFDDGHGASEITILLEKTAQKPVCDDAAATVRCETLADGSTVASGTGLADPGEDADGVLSSTATLHTVDGFVITVTSYNSTSEKDTATTRARPALSPAQLVEIAQNAVWLSR